MLIRFRETAANKCPHVETREFLNQTTGDSYTTVTSCAASTRRSSVGLIVRSLVNQALRGLQSPLSGEPGALARGGDCANVMWFDLDGVICFYCWQHVAANSNRAVV